MRAVGKFMASGLLVVTALVFAAPSFAAGDNQRQNSDSRFEEKKAEHLKRLDERRACIQAAKNHDEMKACGDKFGGHRPHDGAKGNEKK